VTCDGSRRRSWRGTDPRPLLSSCFTCQRMSQSRQQERGEEQDRQQATREHDEEERDQFDEYDSIAALHVPPLCLDLLEGVPGSLEGVSARLEALRQFALKREAV